MSPRTILQQLRLGTAVLQTGKNTESVRPADEDSAGGNNALLRWSRPGGEVRRTLVLCFPREKGLVLGEWG